MTLYWHTDKIIAGKYRLKKPIPMSCRGSIQRHDGIYYMLLTIDTFYDYQGNDDKAIEYIEKNIERFEWYLEDDVL